MEEFKRDDKATAFYDRGVFYKGDSIPSMKISIGNEGSTVNLLSAVHTIQDNKNNLVFVEKITDISENSFTTKELLSNLTHNMREGNYFFSLRLNYENLHKTSEVTLTHLIGKFELKGVIHNV